MKPFCLLISVVMFLGACANNPVDKNVQRDVPNDVITEKITNADRDNQEKNLHLKLVNQMLEQNSAYAALAHLDAYDKQWGVNDESRLLRADALRLTNQIQASQTLYKQLTVSDKTGRAWSGLGKLASGKGDWQNAAVYMQNSINQAPLKAQTYSDLGLCYVLLNQRDEAKTALFKAVQLSPDNVNAQANLALWGYVFDDRRSADNASAVLKWPPATVAQVQRQAYQIRQLHLAGKVPGRDVLTN